MSRLGLLVLALTMVACGGKKDQGKAGEEPPSTQPATPVELPADAAAEPAPAAGGFDRAAFCNQLLTPATLASITGMADFTSGEVVESDLLGVGRCSYSHGNPPDAIVELDVDCREFVPDLDKLRAVHKKLGEADYREVAIGGGGAYARQKSLNTQQLTFLNAAPACTVQVRTRLTDGDYTEALAKHVAETLTVDNAPGTGNRRPREDPVKE